MSALVPTLRDFQPILALVDAGLIQATFKFSDLRSVLSGFGALTPDVDTALKIVEADPTLIAIGIQQFKDALAKYPLDTPLTDIFGGSTAGGGTPVVFTPEQIASGSKALFAVLQNVQKVGDAYLTTPSGQKIVNELNTAATALTKLEADYASKLITTAQFNDKAFDLSTATSALAVTTLQFLTGKAPTRSGLSLLIDNPNSGNDLTDVANLVYSVENRYIKFMTDELKSGLDTTFRATYGALSFPDAVAKIYDAVIGAGKAAAAGVNVSAALAYVVSERSYFASFGGDDLGAKAAAAGFLISKGIEAHLGVYSDAAHAYLAKIFAGDATYGDSILPPSAPAEHVGVMGAPVAQPEWL